ncbi:hypothetical protein [Aureimonas sp. ME7]|uniref:hypothetical protein n=1 Tax=Aureimonas sp. ME7 TaxID=2744252 RepID=UPI0015F6E6A7|nr:hypothetical protein [Aureimonas sp. ME7]
MSGGRQMIRIEQQIQEAEIAFKLRETEITRAVQRGAMREAVGQLHVQRLRAAMQTLEWLAKNEAAIKAKVASATGAQS